MVESSVEKKQNFDASNFFEKKMNDYQKIFRSEIENIFIDKTNAAIRLIDIPKCLPSAHKGRYKLAISTILQFANVILPPSLKENINKRYGYTEKKIPYDPRNYNFKGRLDEGGVNKIFKFDSNNKDQSSFVLKVNCMSYNFNETDAIFNITYEQKKEYEKISSIYKHIENFILPEYYLLIHGPRDEQTVVAMIQPFIQGKITDVFNDYNKQEIIDIFANNEKLSYKFNQFIEATKSNPDLLENELDLIGNNNLAIVFNNDINLMMIEPHNIFSKCLNPRAKEKIIERFSYLEEINNTLQK